MREILDSAWRAAAYCMLPRVILLSLFPLLLMAALAFGLSYYFWVPAMDAVHDAFESWDLTQALFKWLEAIGLRGLKSLLAPLTVIFLATPVLVVLCLLSVALIMVPFLLNLVARRRFPELERRHGGTLAGSLFVGVTTTVIAMVALVVSIPFWLIPPVVLVVPPLIWGWLTYRVMSYDVLAAHASKEERRELVRRHRPTLLAMGVITGFLGALPSVVWTSGAAFVLFAPWLIPVAVWIYTLVFAFSALWFTHHLLAALAALRAEASPPPALPLNEPAP